MKRIFLCIGAAAVSGAALLGVNPWVCAADAGSPVIQVAPTTHTFPPVFEGETLSHRFTVRNRGDGDLEIKKVTTS